MIISCYDYIQVPRVENENFHNITAKLYYIKRGWLLQKQDPGNVNVENGAPDWIMTKGDIIRFMEVKDIFKFSGDQMGWAMRYYNKTGEKIILTIPKIYNQKETD